MDSWWTIGGYLVVGLYMFLCVLGEALGQAHPRTGHEAAMADMTNTMGLSEHEKELVLDQVSSGAMTVREATIFTLLMRSVPDEVEWNETGPGLIGYRFDFGGLTYSKSGRPSQRAALELQCRHTLANLAVGPEDRA